MDAIARSARSEATVHLPLLSRSTSPQEEDSKIGVDDRSHDNSTHEKGEGQRESEIGVGSSSAISTEDLSASAAAGAAAAAAAAMKSASLPRFDGPLLGHHLRHPASSRTGGRRSTAGGAVLKGPFLGLSAADLASRPLASRLVFGTMK
jgi:hypothetical protein